MWIYIVYSKMCNRDINTAIIFTSAKQEAQSSEIEHSASEQFAVLSFY